MRISVLKLRSPWHARMSQSISGFSPGNSPSLLKAAGPVGLQPLMSL